MPAHLRFQSSPWATHHIVSRCIQGYGFLKPTQKVRKVTQGVFAYSAHVFAKRIHIHHRSNLLLDQCHDRANACAHQHSNVPEDRRVFSSLKTPQCQ